MTIFRITFCVIVLTCVTMLGCVERSAESPSPDAPQPGEKKKEEPKAQAELKKVPVGKNITLEIQGDQRRVRVNAEVCLREGLLEQLLTRKRTKEHEAILAADIDARELHLALTLAGAEPGKVVQFRPKLVAPSGTPIKIFLEYQDKGKTVRVPAQQWLRNIKSKKDFVGDWVFAGSVLIPNPEDKTGKPFYGANDGDVIAIVNFETALLDVPFLNTKDNDDLLYQAHTERIPALKTPVAVILEPVVTKKKERMADLTHFDEAGASRMVDTSAKAETERMARASGSVRMLPATLALIRNRGLAKGDVLEVARLAGIMAAKRTGELIPLCHPLPITAAQVDFRFDGDDTLVIEATVRVNGRTGVEMEALTAVSVAALTVYDMTKAVDRAMTIERIRLEEKLGGKSGHYVRAD